VCSRDGNRTEQLRFGFGSSSTDERFRIPNSQAHFTILGLIRLQVKRQEAWCIEDKNSSGDEIANVNFFTTIWHVRTSKY